MSIFPFIDTEALVASQEQNLPMFREYAYDYENNRLLLRDGQTYLVEGNEALRIWIFKTLVTERFRYTAYDSDYGSEIDTLIGGAINSSVILPELKRFIIEALIFRDCGLISGEGIFRFDLGRLKSGRVRMPMICRRESAGSILCLDLNRFRAVKRATLFLLNIWSGGIRVGFAHVCVGFQSPSPNFFLAECQPPQMIYRQSDTSFSSIPGMICFSLLLVSALGSVSKLTL